MTPLQKLRAVAKRRTAGEWTGSAYAVVTKNEYLLSVNDGEYVENPNAQNDATFIAQAANTYDLLLDIAEAAETVSKYGYGHEHSNNMWGDLKRALARLDSATSGPAPLREGGE